MIVKSRLQRIHILMSGAALLLPGLLCSHAALADTRAGATVALDGGYSSAPFGDRGNSKGAATAAGRLSVRLENSHATGKLNIDGSISHTEYSRIYDSKTNYSAGARLSEQLSERTNASLSGAFDSSVVDSGEALLNPLLGDTIDPDLPLVIDPSSAFLQRQRRNSYSVGAALDHRFSEFDTVALSARGAATRFPHGTTGNLREYNYYSSSISYSRKVSAALSIGASFSAARSDYLRMALGDSWIYSPQLTAQLELGRGWSLSGSGGVSFTKTQAAFGRSNSTTASGSLQLCKRDERFNGCASVSRSVLPSSLGAVGNAVSAGVNASYRLDEFSTISGGASYSRNSGGSFAQSQDFLRSSVSYSRRFTSRLSGYITAGYSDSYSGLIVSKANLSGTVGISYSIGMLK